MKRIACAAVLSLAGLGFAQQQNQSHTTSSPSGTAPTPQQEQAPSPPMRPDQQTRPIQERLSAAQAHKQIEKDLRSEPALANTNVASTTDDSSVVLTGTVDTQAQRDLAIFIVQSYAGNRQIVDKIKVRQQS